MVWDRALLQPVPRRLLRHGRLRALPERQRVRSQHWCSGVSADVLANTESEKNVCENVFNTILQHIYYPFSFLAYITFANHIYIYIYFRGASNTIAGVATLSDDPSAGQLFVEFPFTAGFGKAATSTQPKMSPHMHTDSDYRRSHDA